MASEKVSGWCVPPLQQRKYTSSPGTDYLLPSSASALRPLDYAASSSPPLPCSQASPDRSAIHLVIEIGPMNSSHPAATPTGPRPFSRSFNCDVLRDAQYALPPA